MVQVAAVAIQCFFVVPQLAQIAFELLSVFRCQVMLDRSLVAVYCAALCVEAMPIVADGLPLLLIFVLCVVQPRFVMVVMLAMVVTGRRRCAMVRHASGVINVMSAATAKMPAASACTPSTTTGHASSAATTAKMSAAVRVNRARRDCQAAPDGQCAEKFPHDAAPYPNQM
jgi:hypothetical protein